MNARRLQSPGELLRCAGPRLRSRIEHNLLLSLLEHGAGSAAEDGLFLVVEDEHGEAVGAALRIPPLRLQASCLDEPAAALVIDLCVRQGVHLPGVGAPLRTARALVAEWEGATGGTAVLAMAEALHTVEQVIRPSHPPPGSLRPAAEREREFLLGWMRDFVAEAGVDADPAMMLDRRLRRGLVHLWDDGGPVSLVGNAPPLARVVRVGPVYTPPALRGRGYASAAVAAVTEAALAGPADRCMLYTDLANPTSNRVYARLGYRRVAEWEEYRFAGP